MGASEGDGDGEVWERERERGEEEQSVAGRRGDGRQTSTRNEANDSSSPPAPIDNRSSIAACTDGQRIYPSGHGRPPKCPASVDSNETCSASMDARAGALQPGDALTHAGLSHLDPESFVRCIALPPVSWRIGAVWREPSLLPCCRDKDEIM